MFPEAGFAEVGGAMVARGEDVRLEEELVEIAIPVEPSCGAEYVDDLDEVLLETASPVELSCGVEYVDDLDGVLLDVDNLSAVVYSRVEVETVGPGVFPTTGKPFVQVR